MRGGLLLLLALNGACVPWYRVDEDRALAADDPDALAAALADCKRARERSATEGARCFEALLEQNPFEAKASLGLAEALVHERRYSEARVVTERAIEAVVTGKSAGGEETKQALAKQFVASYVDDELYGLALSRARDLKGKAGETTASITLPQASQELPNAFRALAEAQVKVAEGKPKEALDRYAAWLSEYGIPDLPEIQSWADAVLEGVLPLTDRLVSDGDDAMARKAYTEALVSYSLAFRYRPRARFNDGVADKLIEASAYVEAPELLSAEARDLADKAEKLVDEGRVGSALHAYRRAIAIAPYRADLRYNCAALFAALEQYQLAAEQMDWFLALDAGSERAARASELRDGWRKLAPAPVKAP